ncbi:MAG: sulfurtransferase [Proteobacteria bacterium]|nr:sulfurtransferase [Pseudomonadota bacterium]
MTCGKFIPKCFLINVIMAYINISGYKFIKLNALSLLKQDLTQKCLELELKGTILLSEGGINAFLSGSRTQIDKFYEFLPTTGIPFIDFKESHSNKTPFNQMLVKIKAEIVTMGMPDLEVVNQPGQAISPEAFHQWLEEGKDFILLDTRNEYEVRLGKFKNTEHLPIKNFRSFPQATESLPESYKDKIIITCCTGGIRCEKAVPFLLSAGFKNVMLLEGGILKYLEKYPNGHFEGECFVFDKRIAVDTQLNETHTVQCHHCRQPVSCQDQLSEHYIPGKSCPLCILAPL